MAIKILISNAFSLSMLDREIQKNRIGELPLDSARYPAPCDDPVQYLSQWEKYGAEVGSCVGHADTAALFSRILGREIPMNRTSIKLVKGTILLVGQYIGPRLPEGAATLPEGAVIEWWTV
jgi:hypothetical protein